MKRRSRPSRAYPSVEGAAASCGASRRSFAFLKKSSGLYLPSSATLEGELRARLIGRELLDGNGEAPSRELLVEKLVELGVIPGDRADDEVRGPPRRRGAGAVVRQLRSAREARHRAVGAPNCAGDITPPPKSKTNPDSAIFLAYTLSNSSD